MPTLGGCAVIVNANAEVLLCHRTDLDIAAKQGVRREYEASGRSAARSAHRVVDAAEGDTGPFCDLRIYGLTAFGTGKSSMP
jgi:hypothetical protein